MESCCFQAKWLSFSAWKTCHHFGLFGAFYLSRKVICFLVYNPHFLFCVKKFCCGYYEMQTVICNGLACPGLCQNKMTYVCFCLNPILLEKRDFFAVNCNLSSCMILVSSCYNNFRKKTNYSYLIAFYRNPFTLCCFHIRLLMYSICLFSDTFSIYHDNLPQKGGGKLILS